MSADQEPRWRVQRCREPRDEDSGSISTETVPSQKGNFSFTATRPSVVKRDVLLRDGVSERGGLASQWVVVGGGCDRDGGGAGRLTVAAGAP
jgi:hypothetical protein